MIGTPRRAAWNVVGFALGVGLLAAAVWAAVGRIEPESLAHARLWHLLVIAGGVLYNLAATAAIIWIITCGFDLSRPLRWATVFRLISAAHLLNYLPLWPGILGRAAYLKHNYGLPLKQSGAILAITIGVGAAVTLGVTGLALVPTPTWRMILGGAALVVASLLTTPVLRVMFKRAIPGTYSLVALRVIDLLGTAVRLWVAFRVVGEPISFWHAMVAASVGSFVALLGITPNGLGMREWGIALISNVLSPGTLAMGGLAATIDRGVEAVVALVVGLWSIRRLRTPGVDG